MPIHDVFNNVTYQSDNRNADHCNVVNGLQIKLHSRTLLSSYVPKVS
nr:MAG TPA: hypothetical protein [Caudoviricetes sp.]